MSNEKYSSDILEAIVSYLEDSDVTFTVDTKNGVIKTSFDQLRDIRRYYVDIMVGEKNYILYAYLPIGGSKGDTSMMARLGEFLHRANYDLKDGNFDFDYRDGEIRYKIFVDCADGAPSPTVIKNSIDCPEAMLQYYSPGIIEVIFSGMGADEAIKLCEKRFNALLEMYGDLDIDNDDEDDEDDDYEDDDDDDDDFFDDDDEEDEEDDEDEDEDEDEEDEDPEEDK